MNYSYLICFATIITNIYAAPNRSPFTVDFDTSMQITKYYTPQHPKKSLFWKLAKETYDNFIHNPHYSAQPRIPKIIHQIWIGPKPLSDECKQLMSTWKKHNPDWEYKLWRDADIEAFGLTNKKQYDKATNYGEKADIARYDILKRLGGLYADTDFECLKPFEILHHYCDFYTGVAFGDTEAVFIGIIGSAPNNPILDEITKNITNGPANAESIMQRTGPYYFARCTQTILQQYQNQGITHHNVFFPVTYFYPWPSVNRHQKTRQEIEQWIKPETFAIHHWHVSWLK